MLRVVVRRVGVFVHVEAGEAALTTLKVRIGRVGEPLQIEDNQPLAVVHPVHLCRELFVVHSVAGKLHVSCLRLGVLEEMSLPGFPVHLVDHVGCTQRMQRRPVPEVLDGVIRAVESTPALHALEITPLVEILFEESLTGHGLRLEELPFQKGPVGGSHGCVDHNPRRPQSDVADPEKQQGSRSRETLQSLNS